MPPVTIRDILEKKQKGERVVCLTAYDALFGQLVDEAGVDLILVGDSVGNALLGYPTTLPVTMEEMLHHTRAVARGVKNALIVADMPFLSFQVSPEEAVKNAGLFLQAGAHAVKLEGGREIFPTITRLVGVGIPVMGHLGLTPQKVNAFGGYRAQGRSLDAAKAIIREARTLESIGVFGIVLESVPYPLARAITRWLNIPTIGIGAGPDCDGQILVLYDMLGLSRGHFPRFVKTYVDGWRVMGDAIRDYAEEVRRGSFPTIAHSFEPLDYSEEDLLRLAKSENIVEGV
ncbi:MAG: 3-methyl-2-oxobutanoate hydroxymethyltransferase [bacterium JZ-2024 1]